MKRITTKALTYLPNFTSEITEKEYPVLGEAIYKKRIAAALDMCQDTFTHLIIYGDREHFSNMEYFTGYDPRFEEALLVISKDNPVIIVGDEGCSYAAKIPFDIDIVVYPPFSLPGQPRDKSVRLSDILEKAGLKPDSKVGLIGWKLFSGDDFDHFRNQYDIPCFVYNEIVNVTGEKNITNATEIMIGNDEGLRMTLESEELVLCELAGTKSSRNTLRALKNLRKGMTEIEASAYLHIDGDPLIAYPMISFGDHLFLAVASPTHHVTLNHGDLVGVGMAYRRSLCHKTSYFVSDYSELSNDARCYFEIYFRALATWYESVKIGATGGEVYEKVKEVVEDYGKMGIGLNPGHMIHTDEWTNSPFGKGNTTVFKPGMAIQCDFGSSLPQYNVCIHEEDGVVLADSAMQEDIKRAYPKAYQRMIKRREFMKNELGIVLHDTVLPTSDLPGVVFPCAKNLNIILAVDNSN